jgi:4-hydroxy-3-methylbut-2-enyl diphosphate reductase
VRNLDETQRVCDYIRNPQDEAGFKEYFANAMSPGFDPETDLIKIGVANQTTMLSKESLEVAAMLERALADRYGADNLEAHFRSFDTICSATQDRQDALLELLETGPDLSVVIGGYNSSNTNNLANIAIKYGPTYHIEDVNGIDDAGTIHHKKAGTDTVLPAKDWLPDGPVTVAVTAGASTPNNKIGEVVVRIAELHGDRAMLDQLMAVAE